MAKAISETVFLNIPTTVIEDILARLTLDEVGRCRCVCKTWLELLSQPDFVNLHLSKSQTCYIVNNHSPPGSPSFRLVEVEDETNHHGHGVRYKAQIHREIPREPHRCSQSYARTMIGSIDGLVCINEIVYGCYDLIHVWNPITGEFIKIQTPQGQERKYPNFVTYGFVISSGKYHVVRIFQKCRYSDIGEHHITLDSTCHIYTVGTGVWKNIGRAPYLYTVYSQVRHGLSLNGNLHWIVYHENSPDHICCLDLESESFQPFPPPPELTKIRFTMTLNVYKGCISVCGIPWLGDIAIWVMKEYGVQNSWTKEVVISKHLIDHHHRSLNYENYENCCILKVFEDGEILLLWRKYNLFSYRPKTKTMQDFDGKTMTAPSIDPRLSGFEATEYVSSLVSLKTLGEVNVSRA